MPERGPDNVVSANDEEAHVKDGSRSPTTTVNANPRVVVRHRLCAELVPCQPHFTIRDTISDRVLDVRKSFAPTGLLVACWKFGCLCFALLTMLLQWIPSPGNFYLAYMTSWGVFFTCAYFLMSFVNTIFSKCTLQPDSDGSVGVRLRVTWVLAQLAALWGAVVTIKYWYFDHDFANQSIDFFTIATHGVLFLFVAVDVFIVNRIPFRWMHWTCYVLLSQASWVLWSYLHAHVGDIGNPYTSDSDDEVIYDLWDWKNNTKTVLVLTFLDLFVLSPITFMVLWILSVGNIKCCCGQQRERLYFIESSPIRKDSSDTLDIVDIEEGCVPANDSLGEP